MRGKAIDPGLLRAARTGVLYGLWVTSVAMMAYLVIGRAQFGLDSHAYWRALQVDHPYGLEPHDVDAYLYSPLFLQMLRPFGLLPWPVFCSLWAVLQAAAVWWLVRPLRWIWRIPVMLICVPEFILGNVHALITVSLVLGFSRPAVWSFLALTKVAPAAPLGLWLAARGEWKRLATFVGWTALLAGLSVLASPSLWAEWIAFLTRPHEVDAVMVGSLVVGLGLAVVAARRDWVWALPVSVLLCVPTGGTGISGIVIMTAVPRLLEAWKRSTTPSEPAESATVHAPA
jgi:hypothetical protein